MIPKRTLFISALLTAFALATLGGVAVALKQSSSSSTPTPAPVAAVTSTPAALSPQDAATLAGNVLNQKDIYSVESSSLNGTNAYKVVFSSGSVAFVGLDGQILSVSQIQPAVVAQSNPAPVLPAAPVAPAAPTFHENEHESGGDN